MEQYLRLLEERMHTFSALFRNLDELPLLGFEGDQWKQHIRQLCPTDQGIYVFYEQNVAQYVGRSDHLIARISGHRAITRTGTRTGLPGNSATFARLFARGLFKDHHRIEKDLFGLPLARNFKNAPDRERFLRDAIHRVRGMSVRVVCVAHPHDQAVFEVFVHEMLGTPYNSFRNH